MNNNRGWGLRSELWICLAMTIFFAIAIILINSISNNIDSDIILSQDKNETEESNNANKPNNKTYNDNITDKKDNTNYDMLEDKLVIAGNKYANKYLLSENIGSVKIVTIVRLQTENILEPLKMNNIQCSGYIKIEKIEDDFKYYPYISCGSLYETVGYDKNLDNTDL